MYNTGIKHKLLVINVTSHTIYVRSLQIEYTTGVLTLDTIYIHIKKQYTYIGTILCKFTEHR